MFSEKLLVVCQLLHDNGICTYSADSTGGEMIKIGVESGQLNKAKQIASKVGKNIYLYEFR